MTVYRALAYGVVLVPAIANLAHKGLEIQRLQHPGWSYIAFLVAASALHEFAEVTAIVSASKKPRDQSGIAGWAVRLAVIIVLSATYTDVQVTRDTVAKLKQQNFREALQSESVALQTIQTLEFLLNRWNFTNVERRAIVDRFTRVKAVLVQSATSSNVSDLAQGLDYDRARQPFKALLCSSPEYLPLLSGTQKPSAMNYLEGWMGHLGLFALQVLFLLLPYVVASAALCGMQRLTDSQHSDKGSKVAARTLVDYPPLVDGKGGTR